MEEPKIEPTAGLSGAQGNSPAEDSAVEKEKPVASAQLRGEVMAYATQSALLNLGGNFFEPYVNYRVQRHFAKEDTVTHKLKYGTYTQNLAGEFAGDLTGAAALILAELICPDQLHRVTRRLRACVDPLYEGVAHRVFAKDLGTPDYEKKVEEWKTFQERNLVRSAIVAAGNIAGNLLTQKYIVKNPSPIGIVFAGKLASTSLTTALGLSLRLALPKQMDAIDERISKKFFAPLLSDRNVEQATDAHESIASHAERLRKQADAFMYGMPGEPAR